MNVNSLIGTHDFSICHPGHLALRCRGRMPEQAGQTPNLAKLLPGGKWESRHSPGSFTYAAHQAFFAGFLPTPDQPGKHPRLFALSFAGSETTSTDYLCIRDRANIIAGFGLRGYHTICIGGVGFFNKQNPLWVSVLPGMFAESHWHPGLGVTNPNSTENQVQLAIDLLSKLPARSTSVLVYQHLSTPSTQLYLFAWSYRGFSLKLREQHWPMSIDVCHRYSKLCSNDHP